MNVRREFFSEIGSPAGILDQFDMSNTLLDQKNAIVIGALSGIGYEFARLIAKDAGNLILVDFEENMLLDKRDEFLEEYDIQIRVISEDLSLPSAAESIFDASLLYHLLGNDFGEIDLMINCLTLDENPGDADDYWEDDFSDGNLNVFTLLRLNELFAKKMALMGRGKILNVITSTPRNNTEYVGEMFINTLELVEDFSSKFRRKLKEKGIQLDSFFSSPNGLIYRGMNGRIQFDNPAGDQLEYIANYGYQILMKEEEEDEDKE